MAWTQLDDKVLVSTTGTDPTVYGVSIPLTPDGVATIDLPAGLPSQLLASVSGWQRLLYLQDKFRKLAR